MSKTTLRDKRKPGHGWYDNEIYDVFGDELGERGIGVYIAMTRHAYGTTIEAGLRELADTARMSKDTFARNLKRVIGIGLVIERKGATPQSRSRYELADVKALVAPYQAKQDERRRKLELEAREAVDRTSAYDMASVSDGDSSKEVTLVDLILQQAGKDASGDGSADDANCLTVRQIETAVEDAPVKILSPSICDRSVSNPAGFETEVSHQVRHPLMQDTRPYKDTRQVRLPPTPPRVRGGGSTASAALEIELGRAVAKVMRECNLSDPRTRRSIERAMRTEASKTDDPPAWNAIAERMISARQEYAQIAGLGLLRYTVRMPKFFGEGLWCDPRLWEIDKKEEYRLRRW